MQWKFAERRCQEACLVQTYWWLLTEETRGHLITSDSVHFLSETYFFFLLSYCWEAVHSFYYPTYLILSTDFYLIMQLKVHFHVKAAYILIYSSLPEFQEYLVMLLPLMFPMLQMRGFPTYCYGFFFFTLHSLFRWFLLCYQKWYGLYRPYPKWHKNAKE